jgi:hypothetical protein
MARESPLLASHSSGRAHEVSFETLSARKIFISSAIAEHSARVLAWLITFTLLNIIESLKPFTLSEH